MNQAVCLIVFRAFDRGEKKKKRQKKLGRIKKEGKKKLEKGCGQT